MPSTTITRTARKPAANPAPSEPAETYDESADYDAQENDQAGDGTLDGVVVSPDLVFTTPKKDRPKQTVAERSIRFSIDGEVYTIIKPTKLNECLAGLVESGARRATEADALFAGATFLRRVLDPDSLARINARLEDDTDDFEITDLFDNLERIALALIRSAPAAPNRGPVPARRRAVGR